MPDLSDRVADIVESALELAPAEQAAFVDQACADDPALRREVDSLLRYGEQGLAFIQKAAAPGLAAEIAEVEEPLPHVIGEYRIISRIGHGGMGNVYLADDPQLQRRVALKVVRRGLDTDELLRRFRHEQRILASLNHPNIAQLHGASVTSEGLPFFVMEYIEGLRLDEYCARENLQLPARLALFRKICAAVHYAHQRLVVHRDIKPSNILVTQDGDPKLLDFGIAKLLEGAGGEFTLTAAPVFTPFYASPEHIRGEPITTASDIYSLGVLLYELLTGHRPYRVPSGRRDDIARAVVEQNPDPPSTVAARQATGEALTVASPSAAKSLRGDLDNIVLMAMRKEPQRRYSSVAQFSDDVLRHLEGKPVIARKDTLRYRTAKFISRNRVGVVAAAVVALAISGGLCFSLWQAANARRQRDVAQRERTKAERINTFLQEMLGAAAPETKGVDVKVADVLAEASRRAKEESATQPDVMAEVLTTLGRTYISIGLYEPAAGDLREAVVASLKANGELHPTTANSMGWLGLALAYMDKTKEGEEISRHAVTLQRRLHPRGAGELGIALYALGYNLVPQDKAREALVSLNEASSLVKTYFGPNHGYYLATLSALGNAHRRLGNLDQAEGCFRQALEVGQHVEARYRIFVAQTLSFLGGLLTDKGDFAGAETNLQRAAELYRELLGEPNASTAATQTSLGLMYFTKGDYAKAETEYKNALAVLPQFLPPEHYLIVSSKAALGRTLTRLGRPAEGEPLLREALEIRRKVLPKDSFWIPLTESGLGECLLAQKQYPEAEELVSRGYSGLKTILGETNPRTMAARDLLIRLHQQSPLTKKTQLQP